MSSASTRVNSFPLPDSSEGKGKKPRTENHVASQHHYPYNRCFDLPVLFMRHTKTMTTVW